MQMYTHYTYINKRNRHVKYQSKTIIRNTLLGIPAISFWCRVVSKANHSSAPTRNTTSEQAFSISNEPPPPLRANQRSPAVRSRCLLYDIILAFL